MFLKTTLRLRAHRYLCACFLMSVFALTNRFLQAGTFRSQTTVPGKKRFCVGCTICIGCCGNVARRRRVFFSIVGDFAPGKHIFFHTECSETQNFPRPYRGEASPQPTAYFPQESPSSSPISPGNLDHPPPPHHTGDPPYCLWSRFGRKGGPMGQRPMFG